QSAQSWRDDDGCRSVDALKRQGTHPHCRPHFGCRPPANFFDKGDFEYTFGERSWNTSRPTASLTLSCPAFTNQILALTLIARLHEMLPASLFDGATGWI